MKKIKIIYIALAIFYSSYSTAQKTKNPILKKPYMAISVAPATLIEMKQHQHFSFHYRVNKVINQFSYQHYNYQKESNIFNNSFSRKYNNASYHYPSVVGYDLYYHYKKTRSGKYISSPGVFQSINLGLRVQYGNYKLGADSLLLNNKDNAHTLLAPINPTVTRYELCASWGASAFHIDNFEYRYKGNFKQAPIWRIYFDIDVLLGIGYKKMQFDYDTNNYTLGTSKYNDPKMYNAIFPAGHIVGRIGIAID